MCLSKTKKQKHFNDKEVFDKTLHQFSQYNKRQILGSYEKLEDYKAGRGVESIFNAIRPKYPVEKYSEVFGYNSGMEIFKENYIDKKSDYPQVYKPIDISKTQLLKKYDIKNEDLIQIKSSDNYKVENAIVYQGAKRHFIKGIDKNRIKIDSMLVYNSRIIHSHPRGTSFSKEDIYEVLLYGSNDIIAFNDKYLYYFNNSLEKYNSIFDTITVAIDRIRHSLSLKVARGELLKTEMEYIVPHLVWLEVAKLEKGFVYESYAIGK